MCSSQEPKRKLAAPRRIICGPKLPGEEREVRHILLHKDLENYKLSQPLPEFLLRKTVKAIKSSLSNPCSAIVPYQPPEKMLNEILQKTKDEVSSSPDSVMDTE